MEDQDGPVTVDVHIVATIGGINHDLGTIDVTEDDSAPQVARALRAIAAALDTPDPPRSLPDEPPATREER